MIRSLLIIMTLIVGIYAGDLRVLECKIDHRDPSFDGTVGEGRSILLFPVVRAKSFLDVPIFAELIRKIDTHNDRLVLLWYPQLLGNADLQSRIRMKRCETALLNQDMLEIPATTAVFEASGIRFLQSLRVVNGYSITDGDYRTGKHLELELELWDVRLGGVVLRSHVVAETSSPRISDQEMILQSVELLYGLAPKFYFNVTDRNW